AVGDGVEKNVELAASLYYDTIYDNTSKERLKKLLLENNILYQPKYHLFWPIKKKLIINDTIKNTFIKTEIINTLEGIIFLQEIVSFENQVKILLLISKLRKNANIPPVHFLVQGIMLIIIKFLANH